MARITEQHMLGTIDMELVPSRKNNLSKRIIQHWDLYILIAIPLLVLLVYSYVPMVGVALAFKNYKVFDGFMASKWVGLDNFRVLFSDPKFLSVLGNTLLINLYKLIFQFHYIGIAA
ncbi:hypothetical protein AB4Z22_09815 [Paenibacillus sp. TAF58]